MAGSKRKEVQIMFIRADKLKEELDKVNRILAGKDQYWVYDRVNKLRLEQVRDRIQACLDGNKVGKDD